MQKKKKISDVISSKIQSSAKKIKKKNACFVVFTNVSMCFFSLITFIYGLILSHGRRWSQSQPSSGELHHRQFASPDIFISGVATANH